MTTELATEYRLYDCGLMLVESTLLLAPRAETRTSRVEPAAASGAAAAEVRHSILPMVL
jgi:hypothetical protein